MPLSYNPREIDRKWQARWEQGSLYEAREGDLRPKFYALTMFPYTSGDLHIGHWYAMAPADACARYKRMQGFNVMHPMGFDAFGLPAENAAIARGIHPYTWTMKNIENMRRQLRSMGASYDWDREVITCLPEYYRWTQWFFLKLYKAGLAYRGKAPVNWCPKCQTVLANEQVVGVGECDRCTTSVTRRELEQWFFRITKYADELMEHKGTDWPDKIKLMQRNWVGKSYGTEISFGLEDGREVRVFTTRPDTVYGTTFFVLAPEHPLVRELTTPERKEEVERYIAWARGRAERERLAEEKEKEGVFTGAYCFNRLSGRRMPIWTADYVLPTYGTGAVMGVPAHDTRDFAFARKYGLAIIPVVAPPGWNGGELEEAWVEPGAMVNSGPFDGMPSTQAQEAITTYLEEKGWGKKAVSYRLRDWLISRQRYWGAPIPMVYCDTCGIVPVPERDLPVLLPPDAEFRPTGESPLKYHEKFVNTTCPNCSGPARRETDTMDTFMCSSWYFFRYASPHYRRYPWDKKKLQRWLPVDLYTGGAEHATMHLLYARFFTKALRDMGLVDFGEPFTRFFSQGVIVVDRHKMSKSRGNVITPDPYVEELGADVVRAYLMFIGPWEHGGEWDDSGISGMARWLSRVWNLVMEPYTPRSPQPQATQALRRALHQTIKKVSEDMEDFHFNTMLAALMELTNLMGKVKEAADVEPSAWEEARKALLLLLAPTAPHLAEELWERLGQPYSIHLQPWPKHDPELAREDEITLVIQVNGKLRDRVQVPASITEEQARELALSREKVQAHLAGKAIEKAIFVPGRLLNLVVR
ncbi:MAG: leucine--tRNA ligase [Chloroflexi bacterium]|nr:leucine--tRNA ligase [Chloroflexota bacterium]